MRIKNYILACVMALLAFTGSVHAVEPSYKINPGDILRIDVWNEETLTRELIVHADGFISFPLVGEILVGKQTTLQAKQQLAKALGQYLKDEPNVTVDVLRMDGNKIYIIGKVNRPGEFPMSAPTDVMQALAIAGGLNTFASENNINILRRIKNGEQISIPFEYGDVKNGKQLQTNIVLQSGDVVVVP